MDGGKLSIDFPKYHHISEVSGGKLVEVSKTLYTTFGNVLGKLYYLILYLLVFADLHS